MDCFNPKDYWEHRLSECFSLKGVGHLSAGKQFNKWVYRVKGGLFMREVKSLKLDLRKADVLDIGSGTGFYIDKWKALKVNSIIGVDIAEVAVNELRHKYPQNSFYCMDISGEIDLIREMRFDIISAIDVLFHIVDDERYINAINNISRLLKPDGVFIFTDIFARDKILRLKHMSVRRLDEIVSILRNAGFAVIKRAPFLVLMNEPIDSECRLHKKFWNRVLRASRVEAAGFVLGAVLFPIESALVSIMKEGPTSEIMICRKSR